MKSNPGVTKMEARRQVYEQKDFNLVEAPLKSQQSNDYVRRRFDNIKSGALSRVFCRTPFLSAYQSSRTRRQFTRAPCFVTRFKCHQKYFDTTFKLVLIVKWDGECTKNWMQYTWVKTGHTQQTLYLLSAQRRAQNLTKSISFMRSERKHLLKLLRKKRVSKDPFQCYHNQ